MIMQHLPVLQVVVPLLTAPLCVIMRHGRLAWAFTTAISWACLVMAVMLLLQVLEVGVVSYHIGGWAPPWGIEYRVDLLSAFVLVIVSAVAAIVALYARLSVEREIAPERVYLFYTMYCLCLAGLLGIAITGDAFNLFVFLEISSLSSYVLISMGKDRRALTAAYRYLIMGTIGATFYIIGVGLLYMMTGTLNMMDLAERLPTVAGTRTVLAALAFLTVGIGLKLAMAPLHLWLPNAYAYAPSVVTALLAATATKVAIYALIRIYYTIFGKVEILEALMINNLLIMLAFLGIFGASAVAIFQNNVKRMLAYSSIAQIGYMVLGISLYSVTGLAGGIIHLFNHAMTKGALFLALGCMFYRFGSLTLNDLAGMGRRMPLTMAAFLIGGLSLIGIPLTAGFVSKWLLVQAVIEDGNWHFAVMILVSSLLAVIYIWRVVEVAYFRPPMDNTGTIIEAPLSMLVPTWILALACVWFGIFATSTADIALRTAAVLLGATP
ncbi:MAG: monovalent cation/H+ antiporter subunit D family protein [Rhodospirillales bacterium]